jgi:hypothetical protein
MRMPAPRRHAFWRSEGFQIWQRVRDQPQGHRGAARLQIGIDAKSAQPFKRDSEVEMVERKAGMCLCTKLCTIRNMNFFACVLLAHPARVKRVEKF